MKAQLNHIQDILGHTYDKFYIPIYQRSYAWSSKQINRFILDIEFILTSKKQEIHFFGNIIYIEHKEPLERYIQKQIIDGQQRITSFFLLFYALYNNSVVDEKEFANEIKRNFLDSNYDKDDKYKLRLKDKEIDNANIYHLIANNQIGNLSKNEIKKYKKSMLYINYLKINEKVKTWIQEYGVDKFWDLITRLKMVEIVVEKNDELNPQKIFETLNSTGMSLTKLELICNFLLINISDYKKQEDFYNYKWLPLKKRLSKISNNLDNAIRMILIYLNKGEVKKEDIYEKFKALFENNTPNEIIEKINNAIDLYDWFYQNNNNQGFSFESFLTLDPKNNILYAPSYMLIRQKYWIEQSINEKQYNNSIKYLSEFILRRKLNDEDTSPITRFFTDTFLNKIVYTNHDFDNELHKYLFDEIKTTQMSPPSDNRIIENIKNINFYKLAFNKVLFWYLECYNNKILIDWTKISIEHIAPQNPKNNTWKELLEAENDKDYEEKVNLLGNLTIVTKDANNNLSNGDWQEKRQKLSHFKHIKINESLLKKDIFNYEVIQQRSKELVKDFLNIFKS